MVSFGTVGASHAMPPELKKVFLDTFKQFPDVTFLWKYEKPEHNIASGYPNVIAEPWLPQTNLLGKTARLSLECFGSWAKQYPQIREAQFLTADAETPLKFSAPE